MEKKKKKDAYFSAYGFLTWPEAGASVTDAIGSQLRRDGRGVVRARFLWWESLRRVRGGEVRTC